MWMQVDDLLKGHGLLPSGVTEILLDARVVSRHTGRTNAQHRTRRTGVADG
jgi:hypothetical protein